jgi:hypothetical protein
VGRREGGVKSFLRRRKKGEKTVLELRSKACRGVSLACVCNVCVMCVSLTLNPRRETQNIPNPKQNVFVYYAHIPVSECVCVCVCVCMPLDCTYTQTCARLLCVRECVHDIFVSTYACIFVCLRHGCSERVCLYT